MPATASLDSLVLIQEGDLVRDWTSFIVQDGVQVSTPLRAPDAVQYARGGLLVGHTFTVTRTHNSYAAAATYLDDLPRACGRAYGNFSGNRGLGGTGIALERAKVRYQPRPLQGILTVVTFTVTGSLPAGTT